MNEDRAKELAVYVIMQTSIIDPNVGGDISLAGINTTGFKPIPKDEVKKIVETINGRQEIMQKTWSILSAGTEEQKERICELTGKRK